jgi:glutamate synthase (NADPH/NADH) small chain
MTENKPPEKKTPKKPTLPRQPMPEQDPQQRAHNFYEVALGYTEELALQEAGRCLQCKKPKCIEGCPVEIDIPAFVKLVSEGDYSGAARKLKEKNALPAICGRVCPQETQCEGPCAVGKIKGNLPVAIGHLERFAADWERSHNEVIVPEIPTWTGKRIAVIGAGPAGLTAAATTVTVNSTTGSPPQVASLSMLSR